jgi:hypothetical protein
MNKIITLQDLCQEAESLSDNLDQLVYGFGGDILMGLISQQHCRNIVDYLVRTSATQYVKIWEELLSCDDQLTQAKYKIFNHGGRQ